MAIPDRKSGGGGSPGLGARRSAVDGHSLHGPEFFRARKNPLSPQAGRVRFRLGGRWQYQIGRAAGGALPVWVHGEVRSMDIHFTALSFSAPEKIRFRHKLEGSDSDWVDDGNTRSEERRGGLSRSGCMEKCGRWTFTSRP